MRSLAPIGFLLVLLTAAPAPAEEPPADQTVDVASFRSPTAAPLARLALAVAGVGLVGLALTAWARRRQQGRGDGGARIRVLASRSLGPRHQITLLEVGEHRLLVGMSPDSIATLADLSGELGFAEALDQRVPVPTEQGQRGLVDVIGRFEGLDG